MAQNKENYVENPYSLKLIYVYSSDARSTEGFLKVGDASADQPNEDFSDNSKYLKSMAEERIRAYEHTAEIDIKIAVKAQKQVPNFESFKDGAVHSVLENSGYSKVTKGRSQEWFKITPEIAQAAIDATRLGKKSINGEIDGSINPILFRPEQEKAIQQTIKTFKKQDKMLWNAKMRFGKTLSALEVIKRTYEENANIKRVLILTHRPVVDGGWYEDFNKIFTDETWVYASKNNGKNIKDLQRGVQPFIYFASMQDLRGSNQTGGKFDKNEDVFSIDWDLVILDEAHEGTQTELAQNVINQLSKDNTKILELSGTPFNLMDSFEEEQIFTWDYTMEQEAKNNWPKEHGTDSNPYEDLPDMKMFVYQLSDKFKDQNFSNGIDKSFNFDEFFKVEDGKFVYEKSVIEFLDLISNEGNENFPYQPEYRELLRHTIWTLPKINSANALEKLLKEHPVFGEYNIANVVGKDDKDENTTQDDLDKVRKAITDKPGESKSITLTVRKLTVGVSVPEWTGILVLNNTESATNYLQSIFRVQTPGQIDGMQKQHAYVFDFAPDRSLKMFAAASMLSTKAGTLNTKEQKDSIKQLLNFFPVISINGNSMEPYSVDSMLRQLKRAQAERAVMSGFDDSSLYNDNLLKVDDIDLKNFEKLGTVLSPTKQSKKLNTIDVNKQGMNDEEYDRAKEAEKKPKKERTPEEQALIDKRNDLSKQRQNLISNLRGISIRMPLMIYGLDIEFSEDIDINDFVEKVDDISWKEFMPNGVTKEFFLTFRKYYDADVFTEAGRRIRQIARSADELGVQERIEIITSLFAGFKNPDKETVLTPWRVVNMHLGESLGGNNFFDETYPEKPNQNGQIRYIEKDDITERVFDEKSKILEINSKTGLYPLYMAFTFYQKRFESESQLWDKNNYVENDKKLWQDVLVNNIFVLNKSPMAKTITYRTLNGYDKNKKISNNLIYVEDLVNKLKTDLIKTTKEILEKFGMGEDMKFDVVVGNPPYQENDNGQRDDGAANASASPLYDKFFYLGKKLAKENLSLIFPARWMTLAGKGLANFSRDLLNDKHFKSLTLFQNATNVFPSANIKGGVIFFNYDINHEQETNVTVYEGDGQKHSSIRYLNSANSGVFMPFAEQASIFKKIIDITPDLKSENIQKIVSVRNPYGLSTDFFKNPAKYNLPPIFAERSADDNLEIFGLDNKNRASRFAPRDYPIALGIDTIEKWKVFVPYAYGTGVLGENGGTPLLGAPLQIATETFLRLGNFNTEFEARALMNYYKTKFFRAQVGILKVTQHSTTTFCFVPLQDFTPNSDIDWTKTISEIDQLLYDKYGLTDEEIKFIEDKVKAMD